MKKIIDFIIKDIKVNYKFYLVTLFLLLLFLIRFDYYIYSPGGLIDLTDRINVEGAYKSKGSFNLTYVTSRDANIPNIVLSYIIPSWDKVSIEESRIEDESAKEIEERNKVYLKETSYDAIIAAFKEAGIEYKINNINITVSYIFKGADTNLEIGDIIKSINGVAINSYESLRDEISKYKENDKIEIEVLRNNKSHKCYSVLFKENDKLLIGVALSLLKDITTNPKVEYVFKNNESGSSRGLMCALDIYNKITKYDLTKGRIIAGTGSIDEDGNVGEISGVKYKLKGAVNKGASIFIVPKENYDEALSLKKKYNYNIKLIKVDNLHDVIEELKK